MGAVINSLVNEIKTSDARGAGGALCVCQALPAKEREPATLKARVGRA
jgi:hypothetical protein